MSQIQAPVAPHTRIFDFLPEHELERLLDWTMSIRDRFKPAIVSKNREFKIDSEKRIALTTRKLGPLEEMLRERLLGALPELMASTGTGGVPPTSLELELAAHGDGAYYRPHIDLMVGADRQPVGANPGEDRVLSAVYYFYFEPKAFSGGELRLFPIGPAPAARGGDNSNHIDLEPVRNSLVAFPPLDSARSAADQLPERRVRGLQVRAQLLVLQASRPLVSGLTLRRHRSSGLAWEGG